MLIKNGALLCTLLTLAVPAWADAPIAPGAVAPMTRDDYPKTFAKWGAAGVKKINELAPRAAAFAARSSECDRVEIVELSDARSIPGKSIVFFADCRNGKRFYVSDTDIAAGNEVVSQTAKMANMDDGEAILACEIAVKAQIKSLDGFAAHADANQIMSWLGEITSPKPAKIFIVHGDATAQGALKSRMLERLSVRGGQVTATEPLLPQLAQRVRDVRQGPDGWLYLLTDEDPGQLLRLQLAP